MANDDIILRTEVRPFEPGFCPQTQQELADAIAASLEVFFPAAFTPTIKSPNQPSVEQRGYTWNKVDADTGQSVGYFEWNVVVGAWTRNHWNAGVIPTFERRIFVGTLTQLETYDGGSAGTVSQSTGPFWERDTAFSDKWPLGVGALIVAPLSTLSVFDDAVPGTPDAIGVYIVKPTARLWEVAT